ncbi:hypothetical protein [Bacillus atrophaeus]|uniref:hypothetical protein n=1 Tax=Bacillus atrophaeus TaxID=1452 RepID=UPI00227FA1ED|nr:hypothetical protein [Bacillus atrophaeus]MCY8958148.1 hypothetical protein [Bacillus atrophaeus]MCY8963721.1 hypothetical protein [Bacillus atrophaeus]MCY9440259.1 hypothetical protein [Bacillus atrophaeus]MEC0648539.1 hypothetical protein [Bacillus atrophaeus]
MAKNMKEIAAMIEFAAKQAIQKQSNTKKTMVKTGQEHVQFDVYDAYDPLVYERTTLLKDSFVIENHANGISLDNTREDNGKDVATVVETGQGYTYPDEYGYGYGKPRPVMKNTAESLKDGRLVVATKKDLNASGIKTE